MEIVANISCTMMMQIIANCTVEKLCLSFFCSAVVAYIPGRWMGWDRIMQANLNQLYRLVCGGRISSAKINSIWVYKSIQLDLVMKRGNQFQVYDFFFCKNFPSEIRLNL